MRGGITLSEDNMLVVAPPKYPATEIKDQLGGRLNKQDNTYKLHPTALNCLTLHDWYGDDFMRTAPDEVLDIVEFEWGFAGFEAHPDLEELAHKHPYWGRLYDFQKRAVEFIVCNPHCGALLGLSPGLGKTVVTIISLDVLQVYKVLITAPLTLARNWIKEVEGWQQYFRSCSRATASHKDPYSELTVTNFETILYTIFRDEEGNVFTEDDELIGDEYDKKGNVVTEEKYYGMAKNPRAARKWIDEGPLKLDEKTGKKVPVRERITQARPSYAKSWETTVVDESILLKNRKAVKVGALEQIGKISDITLLLSGSPTAKFRNDLYPQIKLLHPKAFSSYWRFTEFFCNVDKGIWGWDVTGDRPDHDPQEYLKDFFLVMNQKDVLPELPEYIYDPIEIDLNKDQEKAFQQMVDEWVVALDAEGDVEQGEEDLIASNRLAQRTRMLQITSNLCNLEKGAGKPMPRSSAKEDLLVDLINQGDIEFPLLVWTWWVPTTHSVDERLYKHFGKDLNIAYVLGEGMSAEEKDAGIEGYKNGEYDVLILQMGVGKFGHTLTDTKTVFYHDRSDDSDAYLQSLRRVRRIGLDHRPRLIVPRAQVSADPIVEMNLAGKLQSVAKVASHDLQELLRSLGNLKWAMENYDTGFEEI